MLLDEADTRQSQYGRTNRRVPDSVKSLHERDHDAIFPPFRKMVDLFQTIQNATNLLKRLLFVSKAIQQSAFQYVLIGSRD